MPLITLSRNQFLKQRPKGDYQAYRRYLDANRAGIPHGVPKGKLVDLPMNPAGVNALLVKNLMSGYLNPVQMRRQAVKAVNDSIATSLGDLRSTTRAEQEQATRQASAYEGFAKALGEMRRSDADYVADLYRDTGADQARFAQGVTGAAAGAAQSDAAAQQRDIAAATGGMPGYQGTDVPNMQGVGYFLGGYLPSANLSENAAYAADDFRRQDLAAAARLGLEGAGMRQKAIDLQKQLAEERTKLVKQRPSLVQAQLKDLSGEQRANLATLANVLYLQNTQAKTTADLLGTYQGQPTKDTYRDKQGNLRTIPSGYQVKTRKDGSQYLAPLPRIPSSSATPRNKAGLTPSQVATQNRMRNEAIQSKRSDMLQALQNTKGPLYQPVNALLAGLPGQAPKRKSYTEAKAYLLTNYANDLIKQYPAERARIMQMVEESLASAGFKQAAASTTKSAPAKPPSGSSFSPFFGNPLTVPRKKGR